MDLKQRKLSKSEWENLELPVSAPELAVLRLITQGYHNLQLSLHSTESLLAHLKLEPSAAMDEFLYARFFSARVRELAETHALSCLQFGDKGAASKRQKEKGGNATPTLVLPDSALVKLKSSDQIRMARIQTTDQFADLYEYVALAQLEQMVQQKSKSHSDDQSSGNSSATDAWMRAYYTLHCLRRANVPRANALLQQVVETVLGHYEPDLDLAYLVAHSPECIERNTLLLKHAPMGLYTHQKDIYAAVRQPGPKLVLYIAPTGTGKTLTPLGLSEQFRVIFVCAARHVGLALARSAISIHKKVAIAFGCSAAEDVRLHYFAVKECTRDKRNGRIKKVDNTVGDKVEIMICDVRSYLPAMYYMTSFNAPETIVTYWDEPTITLDYATHPLHKVIQKNWRDNVVPTVVLSSATLPKAHELRHTVADFQEKFPEAEVHSVASHDCRKTIPLVDNDGRVVMPHYLCADHARLMDMVAHCEENLTLLRYLDLRECADFVSQMHARPEWLGVGAGQTQGQGPAAFERSFASIDDVDMMRIKRHYLKVLRHVAPEHWPAAYQHFQARRQARIPYNTQVSSRGKRLEGPGRTDGRAEGQEAHTCGVYVTTKDAYTLTDGPTIFLAQNLERVAKFCIQQANIPAAVMQAVSEKIEFNNQLNQQIDKLAVALEFEQTKLLEKLEGSCADTSKEAAAVCGKGKKGGKKKDELAAKLVDKTDSRKIAQLRENLSTLYSMAKVVELPDLFVPNRTAHLDKWAPRSEKSGSSSGSSSSGRPFTCSLDEQTIVRIMLLSDVDASWKVLLLMGIGVFTEHKSVAYTEIMKSLADQQKLYLIIGDSDYIYGTNYQFCHGYISKDLDQLTQEKIVQMLGRIGRGNVQQDYTVRFRSDAHIQTLFDRHAAKPEVVAMNRLFCSRRMVWDAELQDLVEAEGEEDEADEDVDAGEEEREEAGDEDSQDGEDGEDGEAAEDAAEEAADGTEEE